MNLLQRAWVAPVALIAIAVAGLIPSCDDGIGPGEAVVTVSGTARVERVDGEVETVHGRVSLGRGDTIEIITGSARFELADGVRFAGVAGRAGPRKAGTTVRMGNVAELVAGDLLVTGPEPTRVSSGGTTVTTGPGGGAPGKGSALRLSRTLGLRVGVYRGSAGVDSAGVRRTIPGLRRMEVAAVGELPRTPRPLRFAADDRWDRRYLGAAIALDIEVSSLINAVEATEGADRGSVAYLRSVLPVTRDEASLAELVRPRRVSIDTLVGAIIAGLAEDGSFARRWKAVFGFHDAGATWGLVALDQQVDAAAVSEALRDAVNDTEFPFQVDTAAIEGTAIERTVSTSPGPAIVTSPSPGPVPSGSSGSSPPPTAPGPSSIDAAADPGSAPAAGPSVGAALPASPPATVAPAAPAPSPALAPGGSVGGTGQGSPGPVPSATTPPPAAPPPSVTLPLPPAPPPPVTVPPLTVPRVTLPPLTVPPLTVPPPVTVPPLTVPRVTLPSPVRVPPVTVPTVTLPSPVRVPPVTVPTVTLPSPLTVPLVTVPTVTLPSPVRVPLVTVPTVTLPSPLTVPLVTVPTVTLPPLLTVPPVTVPTVTVPPPVRVPPVTVPTVTVPPPLVDGVEGAGETVGGVLGGTEDLFGEVVDGLAEQDGLLGPGLDG